MDALTWPDLRALFQCIEEQPSIDMLKMAEFRARMPADVETADADIPIQRKRVRHRPTLGRKGG